MKDKDGAGDRIRTGDINLGKVALYQLSYSRSTVELTVCHERRTLAISGQHLAPRKAPRPGIRRLDLLIGDRRVKIERRFDAPAHACLLNPHTQQIRLHRLPLKSRFHRAPAQQTIAPSFAAAGRSGSQATGARGWRDAQSPNPPGAPRANGSRTGNTGTRSPS